MQTWNQVSLLQVVEGLFNVYQLACTYLDLCNYAKLTSQVMVIFTDTPRPNAPMDWEQNLQPAFAAAGCYAREILELHLHRHKNVVS